jgi:hypothetical protein
MVAAYVILAWGFFGLLGVFCAGLVDRVLHRHHADSVDFIAIMLLGPASIIGIFIVFILGIFKMLLHKRGGYLRMLYRLGRGKPSKRQ